MAHEYQRRTKSAFDLPTEIAMMSLSNHSSIKNFLMSSLKRGPQVTPSESFFHASEAQWNFSNEKLYDLSIKERLNARKLKDEANQIVKSTDFQTKQRQINSSQKLAVRVANISQLKEELAKEVVLMKNQIFEVDNCLALVERLFQATASPLLVTTNCIRARRKRIGIDATKDNVEISLAKEIEIIKKWQLTMKHLVIKAGNQNRTNKVALEGCEKDFMNKAHAQKLDDELLLLQNISDDVNLAPSGCEKSDLAMSHPLSWSKYTFGNIQRSQKEREKSQKLCNEMSACLKSCIDDITKQHGLVNSAFKARTRSLLTTKNNFEMHLKQVKLQIQEQERMADLLKKAIISKETPMKVAQTRMTERNKRIDMELCHDIVSNGLQDEVAGLKEALHVLKAKLRSILQSIQRLRKVKTTLEQEINVKDNSLEIDSKFCLNMRNDVMQAFNILPNTNSF